MKRFKILFMALFCAVSVGFVGCSNDDEGKSVPGSDDIIGSWEYVDRYNDDEDSWVYTEVMTFGSDGVMTMTYEDIDYDANGNVNFTDSDTASWNYTYSNGVLTLTLINGSDDYYDTVTVKLAISGNTLYITSNEYGENYTQAYTRVN
ncbi:MAG: hypothetical protein SNH01_09300 [Rikenellaceae bacterium]